MRKILGLTVAALLVIGLVGGGTWAYFSDPETSTGNYLSAGTLDLDLNGVDTGVTLFNVGDLYPGASGNASATISNSGTLGGELGIEFSAITNTESTGLTEYEQDGGSGELGAQATIAVIIDKNTDEIWSTGDIGLKSDNSTYNHPDALDYQTIDSYATDNWSDVYTGNMTAAASDKFIIAYNVPTSANNTIQGDNVTFSIYFLLKQPTS